MVKKITLIILLKNGETTIKKTVQSLEKQNNKQLITKIIVINDASTDNSLKLIEKLKNKSGFRWRIINHSKSQGIASCDNEAIRLSQTKFFIIVPQDVVLTNKNAFSKSLNPLLENKLAVASYSIIRHPLRQWRQYNFWLKCLFSRHLNKSILGLGKFDCFNKELLVKRVGYYDEKKFKSGGEDGDIYFRIRKQGLQTVCSGNIVYHLHSNDPYFSLKQLIIKECQMAEANGVVLRTHGIITVPIFLKMFFRPILIGLLLIPYLNLAACVLICLYAYLYTKEVYLSEFTDLRIIFLPVVNILLLFVSVFYSVKGFLYAKQN